MISFVSSSGRSGTKSLTEYLNRHPRVTATHGPDTPEVERDNLQRRLGRDVPLYLSPMDPPPGPIIEVSWCLSASGAALREAVPGCPITHLVRHPSAFVRSGLARGWFEFDPDYLKTPNACSRDLWPVPWLGSRVAAIAELWKDQQRCIREYASHTLLFEDMIEWPDFPKANATADLPLLTAEDKALIWSITWEEARRYGYSA